MRLAQQTVKRENVASYSRALSLSTLAFLLIMSSDCRRTDTATSGPPQNVMEQHYAKALAADAIESALSPSDLAALHQSKGIGLGLRIDGRHFRRGQALTSVIAYEDIAATELISSTTCIGFAITIEDVDRQKDTMATLNPCSPDDSTSQANLPLVKGKLYFLHSSPADIRTAVSQPGRYLINASWQGYHTFSGPIPDKESYTVVGSNIIPIVVTP